MNFKMSFKNKRVLITAGPTWVPIDKVRVISNIATGETGILLARKFLGLGAKVTLVLGPMAPRGFALGASYTPQSQATSRKLNTVRFNFLKELKKIVRKELGNKAYNIVIHSAAVSDYQPKVAKRGKIKSGVKEWKLHLVPTPKLINQIKKIDKRVFLVGFKFMPDSSKNELAKRAVRLIKESASDLVVANTVYKRRYNAYLVTKDRVSRPICSKKEMANALIKAIRSRSA